MRELGLAVLFSLFLLSAVAAGGSDPVGSRAAPNVVWGNLEKYNDHYIILEGGKRYDYVRYVIIDQGSTAQDPRGNVKIVLDSSGKAKEIYFVGLGIPEAFEKYK